MWRVRVGTSSLRDALSCRRESFCCRSRVCIEAQRLSFPLSSSCRALSCCFNAWRRQEGQELRLATPRLLSFGSLLMLLSPGSPPAPSCRGWLGQRTGASQTLCAPSAICCSAPSCNPRTWPGPQPLSAQTAPALFCRMPKDKTKVRDLKQSIVAFNLT